MGHLPSIMTSHILVLGPPLPSSSTTRSRFLVGSLTTTSSLFLVGSFPSPFTSSRFLMGSLPSSSNTSSRFLRSYYSCDILFYLFLLVFGYNIPYAGLQGILLSRCGKLTIWNLNSSLLSYTEVVNFPLTIWIFMSR